ENKIVDINSERGVNNYGLGGWDNLDIRAVTGGLYGDIYGTKFLRVTDPNSPHFGRLLLNGDGLPQATDIVKLGNQQPKAMLGITNTFNYKNFGFSFLVDGRFGGKMFSASNANLQRFGTAAVTAPGGERPDIVVDGVVIDGSGHAENTKSVTQQQYWATVSSTGNVGIGEANLYDATNIRLRNVQLSYAVPRSVLGKSPIQRA